MLLKQIFLEFIKIGALSFGGGYATLPNIYKLSEKTGWCSKEEVTNMITISQMTPGPLACNIAAYIGMKINGILAGIIATVAFIIPAIIFMGIVCKFLEEFKNSNVVKNILKIIRASALAMIASSSLIMFNIAFFNNSDNINISNFIFNLNYKSVILAIILWFLVRKKKVSTLQTMLISGIIGITFKF